MTKFRILGDFEVLTGGRVRPIAAPKLRQVLALLVLSANRVVHLDLLVDELWSERPPRSAVSTVQNYIYQLRKIIKPDGGGPGPLLTKPAGYLLRLEPERVDADVFRRLAAQGSARLRGGGFHEARRLLRQALDMWRGPALADVPRGQVIEKRIIPLEEQRLHVLELRIQADLEAGLHRELIGELRSLVAAHPLNEWFSEQLIVALSRVGRRSEALQAYQDVRRILNEELGLEPGPELQRLHREVLGAGYPPREEPHGVPEMRAARS